MTVKAKLTSAQEALDFMLAGKATMTFRSEETGDHLTFTVSKWKKAKNGPLHFVKVRTGNDFAEVGIITDNTSFTRGRKSDFEFDAKEVKAFKYVFGHLCQHHLPPKCEVWHEGQCGRCGRPLTDPTSIQIGLGPDCREKMGL